MTAPPRAATYETRTAGVSVLAAAVIAALLPLGRVGAEEIELSSGETIHGILKALEPDGAARVWLEERGVRYGPGRVVCVTWAPPVEPDRPALAVHLWDGSVLYGKLLSGEEPETVPLRSSAGGLAVPLSAVRELWVSPPLPGATREPPRAPDAGDTVFLSGEDGVVPVSGTVQSISADGLSLRAAGRDTAVPLERLEGFVLSPQVERRRHEPALGRATAFLQDGSRLCGRVEGLEWGTLRLRTAWGQSLDLPVAALRRIALDTDRIVYLSDIDPAAREETGFFDLSWPYRRDRSVAGNPIRIGGVHFRRGLGVHARSRLTFPVPTGHKRFLAHVGIDDETKGAGNAVFRVILDDAVVFEAAGVRGGTPPVAVDLPLAEGKILTLEMDFGEDLDAGDHGDWAEARFTKD